MEGENSTSGPQPYQPYEGGDYHLPYFQHQYVRSFAVFQGRAHRNLFQWSWFNCLARNRDWTQTVGAAEGLSLFCKTFRPFAEAFICIPLYGILGFTMKLHRWRGTASHALEPSTRNPAMIAQSATTHIKSATIGV